MLRDAVTHDFRIESCTIDITVQGDLRSAEYSFDYTVRKLTDGDRLWREVFAYRKIDIERPWASDRDGGLAWHLEELDTPGRNACFNIVLGEAAALEATYTFRLGFRTHIESLRNLSVLGGSGCVWYWIAYEYGCQELAIRLTLPKGVAVKATHPSPHSVQGIQPIVFRRSGLLPREFALALVTYERRVANLNPGIAVRLEKLLWVLVGALLSWLVTLPK